VPPATPDDRVRLLRKALMDTMRDPVFLEDAKKSNLEVNPLPGEEMEKIMDAFFNLDPKLLEKLRSIVLR